MEKTKEMSIVEFCEEFDTVDSEATIICVRYDEEQTFISNIKCVKRNVEFWAGVEKGVRFFIDGLDINFHGIFLEAVKCFRVKDDVSVDYDIYDGSGKRLFLVSVLDY